MNTLLSVLLSLAIFVTVCDAQCFSIPLEKDSDELKGCKDANGKIHDFDSEWQDGCNECNCGPEGIDCCSKIKTPVGYDQVKCEKIFHAETCSYNVVEKDNPSKACEVKGYII